MTSCAYAQKPGFFVTAGGGLARMKAGSFTVFNPTADTPREERLETTSKKDSASVARLTVGYNFTENWALTLSYTNFRPRPMP
jgi:hypothetical protein